MILREEAARLIRFGFVGLAATATHGAAAFGAWSVGLPPLLANIIGFLFGFAVSLFGHARWTFRTLPQPRNAALRFLAVALSGALCSNGLLMALLALGWPRPWALAAGIAIVPPTTFLLSRLWAFSARQP